MEQPTVRLTKKTLRVAVVALALLFFAACLPLVRAQAASASVVMRHGFDLQTLLSKETSGGKDPAYNEITKLKISGDGQLTADDGSFVKGTLLNLTELDLSAYTGTFADETFMDCTTLKKVVLPEGARLSRKMFYGCTALEELVWPKKYTLSNGCLTYCALDFSPGYPALLTDRNVDTFAGYQRPVAYLSFVEGDSATLRQGETFKVPCVVLTRLGYDYVALANSAPAWLLTKPRDLEVTQTVLLDGERVDDVDMDKPGVYSVIYSLPVATPSNVASITYTLTVQGAGGGASAAPSAASAPAFALAGLPDNVRMGEAFTLGCDSSGALDASCWKWDDAYFSATFDGSPTFEPLRTGSSLILYEGPDGKSAKLNVTILPAKSSGQPAASTAHPPANTTTGTDRTDADLLRWTLPLGIFIVVAALAILIGLWWFRRAPRQKAAASAGQATTSGPGGAAGASSANRATVAAPRAAVPTALAVAAPAEADTPVAPVRKAPAKKSTAAKKTEKSAKPITGESFARASGGKKAGAAAKSATPVQKAADATTDDTTEPTATTKKTAAKKPASKKTPAKAATTAKQANDATDDTKASIATTKKPAAKKPAAKKTPAKAATTAKQATDDITASTATTKKPAAKKPAAKKTPARAATTAKQANDATNDIKAATATTKKPAAKKPATKKTPAKAATAAKQSDAAAGAAKATATTAKKPAEEKPAVVPQAPQKEDDAHVHA